MPFWRVAEVIASVPQFEHFPNIKDDCIRRQLATRGYRRRVARVKTPISEINRRKRLIFAWGHLNWTIEQWSTIMWSDETWATAGTHRKVMVTMKNGEELDTTCVIKRTRKRQGGWMFWGSFAGDEAGPYLFWEKDCGWITAEKYQQHVAPLIGGWVRMKRLQGQRLLLLQDGAGSHSAATTSYDLMERGILTVDWPPYYSKACPYCLLIVQKPKATCEHAPFAWAYNIMTIWTTRSTHVFLVFNCLQQSTPKIGLQIESNFSISELTYFLL